MNACTLQQARAAKHKAVEMFRGTAAVAGIGITRIEDGVPLRVEIVGAIRKREVTAGR
jgi:hypothetical protein